VGTCPGRARARLPHPDPPQAVNQKPKMKARLASAFMLPCVLTLPPTASPTASPSALVECQGCTGSAGASTWNPKDGYPTLSGFLIAVDGDCVTENCRPGDYCSLSDALSPLTISGVTGIVPIYQCESVYVPGPPIKKGPPRCYQVGSQIGDGDLVWVPPLVPCDTGIRFEILIGGPGGASFSLDIHCSECKL
jgi:hypothetical protein